jgi:MFS family permease
MLKTKWASRAFFLTLCAMGLFAILSSTMSKNPVLKPFASSLGTPDNLLGIVASASTIPGILISLPAASLSDVFGRRKVLLFAAFVFASAPFLYLGVSSWWMLALVRFYHGFATAIFMPVAEASIAELFPTKRGERISLFNSATAAGRALAPFLGGYLLFATNKSFFSLYVAVAIAGVTAFVIALLFLTEKRNLSA